jgi:hypothetical protein
VATSAPRCRADDPPDIPSPWRATATSVATNRRARWGSMTLGRTEANRIGAAGIGAPTVKPTLAHNQPTRFGTQRQPFSPHSASPAAQLRARSARPALSSDDLAAQPAQQDGTQLHQVQQCSAVASDAPLGRA